MLFTVILLQGTFTLLVYAHAGRTKKREVDQAPSDTSTVEAKDLKSGWGDRRQRTNNIKRAKDGNSITYKIPKNQAAGTKGRAINEAFRDIGVQSKLTIFGI